MKQKTLKWMTAICSCLFLSLVFGVKTYAATYNISTNDSWVKGNTEEGEVNYYNFTLPSAGSVTITYQSYENRGYCALGDGDLVSWYDALYKSGSATSPSTGTMSVELEAGKYSIKTTSDNSDYYSSNYRLKVSYTPAHNNEKEPNNTFETAMPLAAGKIVKGYISADDGIDFYKITVKTGQTVKITLNTLMARYYFSLWNSELVEVIRDDWYWNSATKVWEQYLTPGTYYIKVSRYRNDWDYTGTYTLKWSGFTYVNAVNLKKSNLTLDKGKSYNLYKSIAPSNATNKYLKWTSDNTSVATVTSNGKVTAKGVGAATITAATTDGSEKQASCIVVVKPTKTKISKCKLSSGRHIYVKIKKQKNISGIQYQLCKKKNFKGKKSSFYAGATEVSATTDVLSKNKTYYVRVRTYINVGDKTYYGAWSDVKKIKTKKKGIKYGYYAWKNV